MIKTVQFFLRFALLTGAIIMLPISNASADDADLTAPEHTAYDFMFHALQNDDDIFLSQFKGEVILIVNTASQCGFTGQYEGLEKLYETYKDRGLVIIGVPSNDFGNQEPGTGGEIAHFCKLNYGVTFPMTSKEVVTGDNAHPFYRWARNKLGFFAAPKWNFHKYLIDRSGNLVDYFYSTTGPDDNDLVAAIEKYLDEKPAE